MTNPRHITRPQGGGMRPILSVEQVEEAVQLRVGRGWPIHRIAAHFYVHQTTMGRYLADAGVPHYKRHPKARQIDPEQLLRTTELSAEGYSTRDIATLLGVHPSTVRYRLRTYARPDTVWRHLPHRLPPPRG